MKDKSSNWVLVVDSSYLEREKIKFILSLLGNYEYLEAQDYHDFLVMKSTLPELSLVIMDIECPLFTDGAKLMMSLRDFSKDVPIIVTTRRNELARQISGNKHDIHDIITKPFNLSRLRLTLSRALHINKDFMYDINNLKPLHNSMEYFISREVSFCDRYKKQFSILFINFTNSSNMEQTSELKLNKIKSEIISIIKDKKGFRVRNTDIVFTNSNGDIVIIMPFTDAGAALCVKNRLRNAFEHYFTSQSIQVDDFLLMVTVTYPDDGKEIAALLETAYNKLESKVLLEKISDIIVRKRQIGNRRFITFPK